MKRRTLERVRFFMFLFLITGFIFCSGCEKNKYEQGAKFIAEGNYSDAVKYYKEQQKKDPKNPVLENQIGYAYAKMGKLNEAIAHYKKAIELKPNYPEVHYNLGYLYMNPPLLKLDDAVKEFTKAIEGRKNYAKAYNNRGYTNALLGNFEQARKDIEKAISLEPDNRVYKANLEWLNHMEAINKSFKEAEKEGTK